MKYNVDYFISKFERLPANKFCVSEYKKRGGHRCALGWLGDTGGSYVSEEIESFMELFNIICTYPSFVNDNKHGSYKQRTIKGRILAALYDIKDKQLVKDNCRSM